VRAVLDHDHADRRQLTNLVATEPSSRPPLLRIELPSASTARTRIVIDDLINLILGLQIAARTPMPFLPTSLATLAKQLLRLRARLRPTLRPRLRRIPRRRPGARSRVLAHLLLQTPQPIPVLLDLRSELKNELDTRLTP
jgi:hypothetical protein